MTRRPTIWVIVGALAGLGLLTALGLVVAGRLGLPVPGLARMSVPAMSEAEYERWAREQFLAGHPGEEPLNWAIARAAMEFHDSRPMGRFVLHENDCSDFVGCVVDHALGAAARFERESEEHALCGKGGAVRRTLFVTRHLQNMDAVQPGDIVGVRHSPWYPPKEDSIGHVGMVGPDGKVLDFVKLISWSQARYGCTEFEWFIHNCAPEQVYISRLCPEYRYLIADVPGVATPSTPGSRG